MENKSNYAIIILLIVIIGGGIFLLTKIGDFMLLSKTLNLENEDGQKYIQPDTTDFNLAGYFEDNFPDYFNSRSNNCELADGLWVTSSRGIGCYSIPVWDYTTMCVSDEIKLLKLLCLGSQARFTCNEHQVSCEK